MTVRRRIQVGLGLVLLGVLAWASLRHGGALWGSIMAAPDEVAHWVTENPAAGAAIYVAAVALGKISPIPGGIVLMLAGGYLFGAIAGPLLAVLGSALCALLVGAAGRSLLYEPIERRFGPRIEHLERVVVRDGFRWLLAARLLPLLPAWLVNLVPVVFPIRLWKVFVATLIGLLPTAFIVGNVGDGLSGLAAAGAVPTDLLLSPRVVLPLLALALLALAPVLLKLARR